MYSFVALFFPIKIHYVLLIIFVVYSSICSFSLLYTLTLNECSTTYPVDFWWTLPFFQFGVLTKNAAMDLLVPVFLLTGSFTLEINLFMEFLYYKCV